MTENPDAAWVHRLRSTLAPCDNIVGLMAGHLHRAVTAGWGGNMLAVCAAVAPHVALDLADIDPDVADGRPMIIADAPAYALHYWNGRELVTHFAQVESHEVIARYTPKLQPLIRMLADEKRQPDATDLERIARLG